LGCAIALVEEMAMSSDVTEVHETITISGATRYRASPAQGGNQASKYTAEVWAPKHKMLHNRAV